MKRLLIAGAIVLAASLSAEAAAKRYVRAVAKLKKEYQSLGGDSRP